MTHRNLHGQRAWDVFIGPQWKLQSVEWVPADNAVLDPNSPPMVIVNPAGAIDILMPASTEARKGLMFLIVNASANAVTLKTSADAAFTTAIVLAANESTLVFCTGSATAALGWRALGTASSA
jgi:hypothetical protein